MFQLPCVFFEPSVTLWLTWLFTNISIFKIAEICISYKTLDTADRNVSTPYHGLCDSYLATKWYRFTGDDGFSYLPESCPQPQQFICGTSKPGWLNGIHPTPAEGIATRTVCYSDNGGCCIYSNTIQVKNCGNFFVYKLAPSPTCNLGYCVTNVGEWLYKIIKNIMWTKVHVFIVFPIAYVYGYTIFSS